MGELTGLKNISAELGQIPPERGSRHGAKPRNAAHQTPPEAAAARGRSESLDEVELYGSLGAGLALGQHHMSATGSSP